jgi:para-aminobenzoate synthetase
MTQKPKTLPEDQVLEGSNALRKMPHRPVVVAIDGRSDAGKTKLAAKLQAKAHVALITLDDFYQTRIPESDWSCMTVEERLDSVFDWDRVRRTALEPLRAGKPGRWRAFDFAKGLNALGTYDLKSDITTVPPRSS